MPLGYSSKQDWCGAIMDMLSSSVRLHDAPVREMIVHRMRINNLYFREIVVHLENISIDTHSILSPVLPVKFKTMIARFRDECEDERRHYIT